MPKIELIGIQTAIYDDIKSSLVQYIETSELSIELVETNDLGSILANGYHSIPLVEYKGNHFYFSEGNYMSTFRKMVESITTLRKRKSHSCKNCGNCKCPADRKKDK